MPLSLEQQRAIAIARARGEGESWPDQLFSAGNQALANIAGMPVDLANAAMRGMHSATLKMEGPGAYFSRQDEAPQIPAGGSETFTRIGEEMGQIAPESTDPNKRMARDALEFTLTGLPFGAAMSGGNVGRMVGEAAALIGGAGGAAVASEMSDDNVWWSLAGSILGAVGLGGAAKLVTPSPSTTIQTQHARNMEREGVELSAGQATGNRRLRAIESELGGATAADLTERQQRQFTRATLRRVGVDAEEATEDVIRGAYEQVGNQFEELVGNTAMRADRAFVDDLAGAARNYRNRTGASNRVPAVDNWLRDLATTAQAGGMSGQQFQAFRRQINELAFNSRHNIELSDALRDFVDAMDNAMERSLRATDPARVGMWQQARNRYRNYLVVEDAVTHGALEKQANYLISPAQLRGATVRVFGRRAYAHGKDPFGDLARSGGATLTDIQNSGTPMRLRAQSLGTGAGTLGGGAAGYALGGGGWEGAAIGATLGTMVPSAVGKAALSAPGRAYLGNQLIPGGVPISLGGYTAAEILN